jgi:hypothetical protein
VPLKSISEVKALCFSLPQIFLTIIPSGRLVFAKEFKVNKKHREKNKRDFNIFTALLI